jgi:asparagine synthase (glutamine-hydrolysing)
MANSLEGRFPYLDNDLVDFSLKLPLNMKLNNGQNKYILKKAAENIFAPGFKFSGKNPFFFSPARMFPEKFNALIQKNITQDRIEAVGVLNWDYIKKLVAPGANYSLLGEKQIVSIICFLEWHDQFFR